MSTQPRPLTTEDIKAVPRNPGVYFIYSNKYFTRLKNKTNILYIGRAKHNLHERLSTFPKGFSFCDKHTDAKLTYNKRRAIRRFYNLQKNGFKLTFAYVVAKDEHHAINIEKQELVNFEQKHLELPPLNRAN